MVMIVQKNKSLRVNKLVKNGEIESSTCISYIINTDYKYYNSDLFYRHGILVYLLPVAEKSYFPQLA